MSETLEKAVCASAVNDLSYEAAMQRIRGITTPNPYQAVWLPGNYKEDYSVNDILVPAFYVYRGFDRCGVVLLDRQLQPVAFRWPPDSWRDDYDNIEKLDTFPDDWKTANVHYNSLFWFVSRRPLLVGNWWRENGYVFPDGVIWDHAARGTNSFEDMPRMVSLQDDFITD